MEITKNQFESYEQCRQDGITNMFMIGNVQALTGLEKDEILYIMANYEDLSKEFS